MVTFADATTLALTVLGAFGGAAAVGGVVAKFVGDHASKQWLQTHKGELDKLLETHKAQLTKENETHKLTLRRQELLFGREVEAADALMALWRSIYPGHSHPDMDWHDACEAVSAKLGNVEKQVQDYLERHSAVISGPVRTKLEEIATAAATEKFFVDGVTPKSSLDAAERVLDGLREARGLMLTDISR